MKKLIVKIVVNILTLTRLIGAFLLPIIFSYYNALTSVIFLAGLFVTDFLDGFLARKFGVSTKGGFHLDQLCDKILGLTVILAFITKQRLLIIPLFFEFSIGLINAIRAGLGESGSSSHLGKVKTLIFSITLILVAINVMNVNPFKGITINNHVILVLVLITGLLEVATLFGYIKEANYEIKHPSIKPTTNEKIRSFNDIKCIVKRLWNEKVFLLDRDKPIQQVIQEELVSIHDITK